MVDNFALFVSQLMMIVVLWRCFILPEEDGNNEPEKRIYGPKNRRGTARGKDARDD